MNWWQYAVALLAFNALGLLAVYLLQRFQAVLPLNPAGMGAVSPDSAFNTAISFVSNTNWQGYAGEATMSYLTQMLALAVQNFLSAATGIAVVFALIRGFAARATGVVGNFWAPPAATIRRKPTRCFISVRSRSTVRRGWCAGPAPKCTSHAPATAARSVGSRTDQAEPLPAHLHGAPAAEAGTRPRAATAFPDRNGGRLPVGGRRANKAT